MDGESGRSDDDRIEWARTVLARHGVLPGPSGYDEATLATALRAHGWDYSFTGVPGAWTAEVYDQPIAVKSPLSHAVGEDRETALLLAFAIALHAGAQG